VGEATRNRQLGKIVEGLGGQFEQLFDNDCNAIFFTWTGNSLCILWGIRVAICHCK